MPRTIPPSIPSSSKKTSRIISRKLKKQHAKERIEQHKRKAHISNEKCRVRVRGFSIDDEICQNACPLINKCKVKTCIRYINVINDLNRKVFTKCHPELEISYGPGHPSIYEGINVFDTNRATWKDINEYTDSIGGLDESHFDKWRYQIITNVRRLPGVEVKVLTTQKVLHPATSATLARIIPEWDEQIKAHKEAEAKDILRNYCDDNNIHKFDESCHFTIEDVIDKTCPVTRKLRIKLIKAWKADTKNKMSLIDEEYKDDLKKEGERWPTAWMKNNKKIMKNLSKWKHSIPILNYLTRNKKRFHESKWLSQLTGISHYITKNYKHCPILVTFDINELDQELRISRSLAYNYIKEFVRLGIIKQHRKHERLMVYSIGFYVENKKNNPKDNYFLINNSDFRKALETLNPYNHK